MDFIQTLVSLVCSCWYGSLQSVFTNLLLHHWLLLSLNVRYFWTNHCIIEPEYNHNTLYTKWE